MEKGPIALLVTMIIGIAYSSVCLRTDWLVGRPQMRLYLLPVVIVVGVFILFTVLSKLEK